MDKHIVEDFVHKGKKIVCVGLNYRQHAAEMKTPIPTDPVVFLKPTTAYLQQGQKIQIPKGANEVHYEVEFGVVIGKHGKSIPEAKALSYVGGYCLGLDMTDRALQLKLQSKSLPFAVAKGFDTSCPVSDFLSMDKIKDPQNLDIWLKVNGETRQSSNTADMIFTVPYLISWISDYFTLEPGDLILTGTPSGVGPVFSGDTIEAGLGQDVVKMTYQIQ